MLRIKSISPGKSDVRRLVREWDQRFAAYRQQLTYLAAKRVLENAKKRIPRESSAYRDSLHLYRTSSKDSPVWVVASDQKANKVKTLSTSNTLLFIRPKSREGKPPPEVLVLERYNPWTVDTLPFRPKRNDAIVIEKVANERQIETVAKLRNRSRPSWAKELSQLGVSVQRTSKRSQIPREFKTTSDTAIEALRLEFGVGKGSAPHWRPSILDLVNRGVLQIRRTRRELTRVLVDSSYRTWKSWPPRTTLVTPGEVEQVKPFVKRLGIRTPG